MHTHDTTVDDRKSSKSSLPVIDTSQTTCGVDLRQACYNGMAVGNFAEVQLAQAEIIRLDAITIDLDPDKLRDSPLLGEIPSDDPVEFYERIVKAMLSHDPVLAKSEVRDTGSGLHVLLRFGTPIEFRDETDREKWSAIVQIVQATLPADPHAPGMTMVTRPTGSINSKNDRTVSRLAAGEPVTPEEVIDIADRMRRAPFATTVHILTGGDRIQPCPLCGKGRGIVAKNRHARCYSCGKIDLARLLDVVYAPTNKEVTDV